MGITPLAREKGGERGGERGGGAGGEGGGAGGGGGGEREAMQFKSDGEREEWEEEQKVSDGVFREDH